MYFFEREEHLKPLVPLLLSGNSLPFLLLPIFCCLQPLSYYHHPSLPSLPPPQVFLLDRGVCRLCGVDAHAAFQECAALEPAERLQRMLGTPWLGGGARIVDAPQEGDFWQVPGNLRGWSEKRARFFSLSFLSFLFFFYIFF